jgi:parallel beta-helix repeat protein
MKRSVLVAVAILAAALPAQARRRVVRPPGSILVTTTIQFAVDKANPGDLIVVPPGVYRESVRVTKSSISIEGMPGAILDGTNLTQPDGIVVRAGQSGQRLTDFRLTGMTIQNFERNGVLLLNVDRFSITDGTYTDNDEYGIFPIFSTAGVIARNRVSGSDDTGIYVGQSSDITIENNIVTDCTVGYGLENSERLIARNNLATGNSMGIATEVLPGLQAVVTSDIQITGNTIVANNRSNPVTDPEDILSILPSGVGIINLGGDRVTITDNVVTGNKTAGIAVGGLPGALGTVDPRIEPHADRGVVRQNVVFKNGGAPDPHIAPLPGADLLWDTTGTSNCWSGNQFGSAFPPSLPPCP